MLISEAPLFCNIDFRGNVLYNVIRIGDIEAGENQCEQKMLSLQSYV